MLFSYLLFPFVIQFFFMLIHCKHIQRHLEINPGNREYHNEDNDRNKVESDGEDVIKSFGEQSASGEENSGSGGDKEKLSAEQSASDVDDCGSNKEKLSAEQSASDVDDCGSNKEKLSGEQSASGEEDSGSNKEKLSAEQSASDVDDCGSNKEKLSAEQSASDADDCISNEDKAKLFGEDYKNDEKNDKYERLCFGQGSGGKDEVKLVGEDSNNHEHGELCFGQGIGDENDVKLIGEGSKNDEYERLCFGQGSGGKDEVKLTGENSKNDEHGKLCFGQEIGDKLLGEDFKNDEYERLCFGQGSGDKDEVKLTGENSKNDEYGRLCFGHDEDRLGEKHEANMKENIEYYRKNVPDDYDQVKDEVNLEEVSKECPSVCPTRDVMVCARCEHGVHRTFLSVCHMRMYACKYPEDKLELVNRLPCIQSGPIIGGLPESKGRLAEPDDKDKVLHFIHCRDKGKIGTGDPVCVFD